MVKASQASYTCGIESCESTVGIISNIELYSHFQRIKDECYVPDMKLRPDILPEGAPLITYEDCQAGSLTVGRSSIRVRYPWEYMNLGETLLYLAYILIELQHQNKKRLTCHAACVSQYSQGILLLGKEGSGKTSVAIDLCKRFDNKLIANDLSVIGFLEDNPFAFGGTKFLFLRRESVLRNLPTLDIYFSNLKRDPWLDKIKVQPSSLGIEIELNNVPITKVYMVHVDETKEEIICERLNDVATRLYLNENFCRYIRSACTVLVGGSTMDLLGYIPSLDSKTLYEFRRNFISWLINEIGIYYISGPLEKVSQYIHGQSLP